MPIWNQQAKMCPVGASRHACAAIQVSYLIFVGLAGLCSSMVWKASGEEAMVWEASVHR